MREALRTLAVWAPLAAVSLLPLRAGSAQAPRPTLIRNATVLTVSSGTIEGGSVLIRDGKIAAVGKNVDAPAGAPDVEVVDAGGKFLMPGIIDCHSHIAVSGGVNEGTLSVTSMVRIGDVIDPEDVDIYRDLAGGVTTANILHGSANSIGGQNQVVKLRWGRDAEGLKFAAAPPGIKFALGENPKRQGESPSPGSTPRYPATRMGVEDVIRDAFNRTREYLRAHSEYESKRARGIAALPPRRNLELEALAEVLQGRRLVHAHCYRSDEILTLIRLAEEFGFKIATFQHVLEGYKVAREIAAHGAGASTFSDWWAFKIEAFDAIPHNAAIMTRKGVVVSINSDSAEEARHLNQEAAKCVKYGGLSETEALKLITLNPAKQLGIDTWVGSIDRGKDADLVLYDRHPFSPAAMVQKVWIDGRQYFDRAQDRERQKEIAALKQRLRAEEEQEGRGRPGRTGEPVAEEGRRIRRGPGREDGAPMAEGGAPGAEGVPGPREPAPLAARTGEREPAARPEAARRANGNGNGSGNGVYAIRNARIFPVSGPPIERGTVVIADGKIAAVGEEVSIPRGARVIEGRGLHVYPGMIDARTTMGLTEIGSIEETSDTGELGDFNPHLQAYKAINPDSEHIPVTRVNGVTSVLSLPAGGIFSGQAALIRLAGWTVEEMAVRRSAGLAATIPAPVAGRTFDQSSLTVRRQPFTEARRAHETQIRRVRDLLDEARHYIQARAARERDASLPSVRRDERLEALIPLLKGEIPLLATANTRGAIRSAVEFARAQKLKLVIVGGADAGKIAPYLKEHDVPVIYGPVQSLPTEEDDPYDLPYATPAILARAGVRFAIASGTTSNSRNLPFEAGTALGGGLSAEDALRAITLAPAQILGVADRIGSIEKGKAADLVVTDGDLLEIRTEIRHLFINGSPVPLESRHTRLYERYRNRP